MLNIFRLSLILIYACKFSTSNIFLANGSDVSSNFRSSNTTIKELSCPPCVCDTDCPSCNEESNDTDFCESIYQDIAIVKHMSIGTFVTLLVFIFFLCMATIIDICNNR